MNTSVGRWLIAGTIGIVLSLFLLAMESKTPLNPWVNIPELPGFLVAIFTVTVNGPMMQFHAVVGIVNAFVYCAVVYSLLTFFYTGRTNLSK